MIHSAVHYNERMFYKYDTHIDKHIPLQKLMNYAKFVPCYTSR